MKSLSQGLGKPIWPRKPIYNRKQLPLFLISADEGKAWFHNRLKVAEAGPGYCHFPTGRAMDYFHMLATENTNHAPIPQRTTVPRRWVNVRRERNEGLDCRCYSIASLHSLLMQGLSLDAHCAQFEAMLTPPVSPRRQAIGDDRTEAQRRIAGRLPLEIYLRRSGLTLETLVAER